MREQFRGRIEVHTYLADSEEAKKYNLKGSTNVFLNGYWVPLEIAKSETRMLAYLEIKAGLSAETTGEMSFDGGL